MAPAVVLFNLWEQERSSMFFEEKIILVKVMPQFAKKTVNMDF